MNGAVAAAARARAFWQLKWDRELAGPLDGLVERHVEIAAASMAVNPPTETVFCMALNADIERSSGVDHYACGSERHCREALTENDPVGAWNVSLYDHFFDATSPVPDCEPIVRDQLAVLGLNLDYWLLVEVAHRLHHRGHRPPTASSDFFCFWSDFDGSEDFELAVAYALPLRVYRQLASQGITLPDRAVPRASWKAGGRS